MSKAVPPLPDDEKKNRLDEYNLPHVPFVVGAENILKKYRCGEKVRDYEEDVLRLNNYNLELNYLFGNKNLIELCFGRNYSEKDRLSQIIIGMMLKKLDSEVIDFLEFNQFLAQGAYSAVGYYHEDKTKMIIKFPIEEDYDDPYVMKSMFHEFFISYIAINDLINVIPNFAYTYGFVRCTPSFPMSKFESQNIADLLAETDENICAENEGNIYIIQEKVGAVNVRSAIDNLKEDEFLNIFLQIFFAMWMSSESVYHLTHGDLHAKNVMIRGLTTPKNISYTLPSEDMLIKLTLKTNIMTHIIDYGRGKMLYDGVLFADYIANHNNSCIGFHENEVLNDIHKFLMSSFHWSKTTCKCKNMIIKLYVLLFGSQLGITQRDMKQYNTHGNRKIDKICNNFYYYDFTQDDRTIIDLYTKMTNDPLIGSRMDKIIE